MTGRSIIRYGSIMYTLLSIYNNSAILYRNQRLRTTTYYYEIIIIKTASSINRDCYSLIDERYNTKINDDVFD